MQKEVLRSFVKFTGKHKYQSLFCSKVAGLRHKKISRISNIYQKYQISSVDVDRFVDIFKLFDTEAATGGAL